MPSSAERYTPTRSGNDRPSDRKRNGYGHRWRKLRKAILSRDPVCKWPGCDRPSHHCDHIVPKLLGGLDHEHNLQGLCASHHTKKTNLENDGVEFRMVYTYFLIAPPFCDSDKFVKTRSAKSDIHWSHGNIMNSLGGDVPYSTQSLSSSLRKAFVTWLEYNNPLVDVWIPLSNISQAKQLATQVYNSVLLAIDVTESDCESNCQSIEQVQIVRDWFDVNRDEFEAIKMLPLGYFPDAKKE